MSNYSRIGSCAWKLFQLSVVLLVLVVIALTVFLKDWRGEGEVQPPGEAMKRAQEKVAGGNVDVSTLLESAKDVRKDVGMLADGTTQVKQIVLWQIIDGQIYYRIILMPYDLEAHHLMASPLDALFISFVSAKGKLIAPKSSPARIETRMLRVATKDGHPVAWFVDGKLPIDHADEKAVDKSVVGWFFSSQLHARLRAL